jgi:hypothetical protein
MGRGREGKKRKRDFNSLIGIFGTPIANQSFHEALVYHACENKG